MPNHLSVQASFERWERIGGVIYDMSPSTAYKDKTTKLKAYRNAGVHEYWIVDPYNQFVEVYLFADGSNSFPMVYNKDETIPVSIFGELDVVMKDIFE